MPDLIDRVIAYESGELSDVETVEFFSELVRTGMDLHLQGSYGRTAARLIELGYLDPEGGILAYPGDI